MEKVQPVVSMAAAFPCPSSGHVPVSVCPGGMRLARRTSGLYITPGSCEMVVGGELHQVYRARNVMIEMMEWE